MALSVASINVERDKHLDTVRAFLKREQPDIVCFQELFEEHLEVFASVGAYQHTRFFPRNLYNDSGMHIMGLGIASRYPLSDIHTYVHRGDLHELQVFDESSLARIHNTQNLISPFVTVTKDRARYRIGMTHFTWTPDGEANDYQRKDLSSVLKDLSHEPDCVYVGDFNAPRGGEIFSHLCKQFTDNVPAHYATSIDVPRHRFAHTAAAEQLAKNMVDGFFTRGTHHANDVRLVSGVSDHMALIGHVSASM